MKENEAIGIIGESGSGKSTLAYAVMDYLATNGSSTGEVLFKGENLLTKTRKEMREYRGNRIAMVYQNPYSSLNPSLTIGQLTVAAVTLTLFIPCIAQVMMMYKERGKKATLAIVAFIFPFAFLVGFLLNVLLNLAGVPM